MHDEGKKTYEVAVTVKITVHQFSTRRAAEDYATDMTRNAFKRTGYMPDSFVAEGTEKK